MSPCYDIYDPFVQTPGQVRANIDWVRPQPTVKRVCKRCAPTLRSGGTILVSGIVSPRGIAHHGNDDGSTDCGLDATGDKWWWPL